MTLEYFGLIADIIAATAVVVSLFYVAVQLRSNTMAIQSAAFQGHADSVQAFVELLSRPEMSSVFVKGRSNGETLSEEETIRFHALMISLFNNLENVFYQREKSVLERQVWVARQSVIDSYIAYSGVLVWWEKHQFRYTSKFQEEINLRIDTVPNKSLNSDAGDAGPG